MSSEDIWSRIAPATPAPESADEWLIRQGSMLLGPVSKTTIINKLLTGEFTGESLVAPDGSDTFRPLKQIAVFRPHVEKAQRLRAARKKRRILIAALVFVFVVLPAAAGGAWWAQQKGLIDITGLIATEPVTGKKGRKVATTDVPELKLVALVDLDKAKSGLKVRGRRKPQKQRRRKKRGDKSGPAQMEGPVGCQLSDKQIFSVVKRSLSRWLVCVQNLADNQPDAVPAKLHLGFTVTTSGSLKDFKILNRHLRRGPFKNCMTKYFKQLRFPSSKGSNCTVDDWPIPLKQ